MAKKKQTESSPSATESTVEANAPATEAEAAEPTQPLGELAKEVQDFIAQREQLAQKLAEEIAATEQKLAELKRTAVMLFPEKESAPAPAAKDRKAKVAAPPKPAKRKAETRTEPANVDASEEESTSQTTANEPAGDQPTENPEGESASIPEGAPHEPHLD